MNMIIGAEFMELYMEKKLLREKILNIRKNMDLNEKEKMDEIILKRFYESPHYKQSKKIFIYISYDSEINTRKIIENALSNGKKIYVPRTEFKSKLMDAVEFTSLDNLVESKFGILEPSISEEHIKPDDLDLIVVPGVAFNASGGRMGYGAGFYDRYFNKINNVKIRKIALAYEFQVVENLPMDEFDIPVNQIITEKNIYGA